MEHVCPEICSRPQQLESGNRRTTSTSLGVVQWPSSVDIPKRKSYNVISIGGVEVKLRRFRDRLTEIKYIPAITHPTSGSRNKRVGHMPLYLRIPTLMGRYLGEKNTRPHHTFASLRRILTDFATYGNQSIYI